MSSITSPELGPAGRARARRIRLNAVDARANRVLRWLAFAAGLLILVVMITIPFELISGASMAFNQFGFAFMAHKQWTPGLNKFGGFPYIYGTLVTSFASLILATLLGVAIGLLLSLIAPRRISVIIGPLVEMLAAIPSVVLGLIGIYLISPFILSDIMPPLHAVLGFIPLFGPPQGVGNSLFTASLVLTIMVVPIIAALTRDLFMTVPLELRDGAEALGATRWEMIRGVVLPSTSSGVIAACVLGFGRAIGEAIAVSQVIGGVPASPINLFKEGNSMASAVAIEWEGSVSALHTSSLLYLATILFVLGLIVNLLARRFSTTIGSFAPSR